MRIAISFNNAGKIKTEQRSLVHIPSIPCVVFNICTLGLDNSDFFNIRKNKSRIQILLNVKSFRFRFYMFVALMFQTTPHIL